ncbi:hypothetical protein [Streptomyces sp. NPDC006510]|uniref:hypothetical protein n=1 Tax=Streptomyces sp. NPDC006510 TaxID=3155600 RepID=UPI0033B8EE5F
MWDIDGAVNGCEVEEYEITAETADERLDEIEQQILDERTAGAGVGRRGTRVGVGSDFQVV